MEDPLAKFADFSMTAVNWLKPAGSFGPPPPSWLYTPHTGEGGEACFRLKPPKLQQWIIGKLERRLDPTAWSLMG